MWILCKHYIYGRKKIAKRLITVFMRIFGAYLFLSTLFLIQTTFNNPFWDNKAIRNITRKQNSEHEQRHVSYPTARNQSDGKSNQKFMIYFCPKNAKCGGWGDQQKFIVDAFLIASITERTFGIILESPCDIRQFYVPSRYNWIVDKKALEGKSQKILGKNELKTELETIRDFNKVHSEDVLYMFTNGDHYNAIISNPHFNRSLPTWAGKFYFDFFHNAWNMLMRTSDELQARLDSFLRKINFHNRIKPFVGVHVRVGRNPSNPKEIISVNNITKLGPLWDFLQGYVRNGSHLFMATDSAEVRQMSRARFGSAHHDTDGVILHIAKQRTDPRACQGYEDALLDQLILTHCDVLVKSKSGFSLRAAFIRGRRDNLFFYHQGNIVQVHS